MASSNREPLPSLPGLARGLPDSELTLQALVDRLLDRGVVVAGEATLSVAGVDLVYLGLDLVLASVETLRQHPSSRAAAGAAPSLGGGTAPPSASPAGDKPDATPWREQEPAAEPAGRSEPVRESTDRPDGGAGGDLTGLLAQPGREHEAPVDRSGAADVPRTAGPSTIDIDPERVEQGLAKLVLTVVELLRRVLDHQAVRRMEGGSLTEAEVERMGLALMQLEEKLHALAMQFGLRPEELNVQLGPLGNLL